MTIKAVWTTVCTGCGKVEVKEIVLSCATARSSYFDIWGPGWPEGWLQVNECASEQEEEREYLFFCSDECYKNWLIQQGRADEAEKFDNAIWMA
jgi:hypothetical protein